MEYLYGLLFGTEPKQSDADPRNALHAKLEALPDDCDAQITLTAAELRILKEATTLMLELGRCMPKSLGRHGPNPLRGVFRIYSDELDVGTLGGLV